MKYYLTRAGDTWDGIAKEVYGSEDYMSYLMQNNQEYLIYFIFPADVKLLIEDLPEETTLLPEWRS